MRSRILTIDFGPRKVIGDRIVDLATPGVHIAQRHANISPIRLDFENFFVAKDGLDDTFLLEKEPGRLIVGFGRLWHQLIFKKKLTQA